MENEEAEPVQPIQLDIYQNKTYRKDLSRLNIDDEPRVQEKQQVLEQQSYIPVSVAYLTCLSNS